MFHNLFNRLLKESPGYERLEGRLTHLEKEMDRLRLNQKTSPQPQVHTTPIHFPPTITINLNKKEESPVARGLTAKNVKKYSPARQTNPEQPDSDQQNQIQKTQPEPAAVIPAQSLNSQDVLTYLIAQNLFNQKGSEGASSQTPVNQTNPQRQKAQPDPPESPNPAQGQTTYIEFLNVENLVVERYEQSNNFGALGIKSLEGKLNIGANYGDKSQLPDDAKKKLEEKIEQAQAMSAYKKSQSDSSSSEKPPKPQPKPKLPFEEFETLDSLENWYDWDNFFNNQPKNAENNKKKS